MTIAPGTRLGPYEVTAAIGAGGMGEVYRATDTKLEREVAVKVLPAAFVEDKERLARFEREAKLLAQLNHSNIAHIYGMEESGDAHALVMELVEGPTLAERLADGPIPVDEALPIARQIAEALEYAHEHGVIHRDLKPANIKLTADDQVKVLDFGLAKAMDTEGSQGSGASVDLSHSPTMTLGATVQGMILGTAGYMAPEQAAGKPADKRADIWAFGVVLYEMLSGAKLFEGDTVPETLAGVLKGEIDLTKLPEETPWTIRHLLARCLERNPKQRLRDIGEARITIETAILGKDETGPPGAESSASERGARRAPLRQIFPWVLAALLVGALVSGLAVWKLAAPAPTSTMHFSAVTNFAGVQAQPALSPDGRSVAFVSNRDGHFNVYVGLARGGNLVQITHDPNLESAPRWSPDGATLAYARLNHWGVWDIWEVPALGGTPRRVILNAVDPAWLPTGKSLAYASLTDGGIWISGTSGEDAHQVAPPLQNVYGNRGVNRQPRVSPDGHEIAFILRGVDGGPGAQLAVTELGSGKTRLLTEIGGMDLSPAWSRDGRFIYFASSRGGTVNIWKVAATGGQPEQITAGEGDDADLDVSRDGKSIVFGTLRQKVGITRLDLRAGSSREDVKILTSDPARNQLAPVYSPDGSHLAYFTSLKGVEKEAIWVSDPDGSNAAALAQDSRVNIFPSWTPDSRGLVYLSLLALETGQFRSVAVSGGAPRTLGSAPLWSMCDVGRDGRVLYLKDKGQAVALDPRTGKTQALGTLPGAKAWFPLRWSPGERSVAYMVRPKKADDPNTGLWVNDFKSPPRQLFHGWVIWFTRGPNHKLYLLAGKPDLTAELWTVDWAGGDPQRTGMSVPLLYDDNYDHIEIFTNFDVSPDGHYLAIETDQVLQENIGMIQTVR